MYNTRHRKLIALKNFMFLNVTVLSIHLHNTSYQNAFFSQFCRRKYRIDEIYEMLSIMSK